MEEQVKPAHREEGDVAAGKEEGAVVDGEGAIEVEEVGEDVVAEVGGEVEETTTEGIEELGEVGFNCH